MCEFGVVERGPNDFGDVMIFEETRPSMEGRRRVCPSGSVRWGITAEGSKRSVNYLRWTHTTGTVKEVSR